jgi:hypothetical protein
MCEDKAQCEFYSGKKWKDAQVGDKFGFKSLDEFFTAFMEYHLFGSSSLECPCCGMYVDPDGNCGNCGWANILLKMGVI